MSNAIDLDRRRALPSNHVFEAHDAYDPTNYFFTAFRDEEDTGVRLNFCQETRTPGEAIIKAGMWIDADQCEQFGNALLAAAKLIRETDAAE